MRTRRANYLPPPLPISIPIRKKSRTSIPTSMSECLDNSFDTLPNDLLLSIFISLTSSASSPAELVNTMQTCKRFYAISRHPSVLASTSLGGLAIKASTWSKGAHHFLKLCADAGNVEACYTLGMIRFYCLQNRCAGTSLLAKAAIASHSYALHSLAIIHFNGSGGTRKDKDLKAGVALCARAAALGHIDSMRELGHCLQDGYGITKNVLEGRRLLLQANAREAAAAVLASNSYMGEEISRLKDCTIALGCFHHHFLFQPSQNKIHTVQKAPRACIKIHVRDDGLERHPMYRFLLNGGCSLLSDFGCNVNPGKLHMAHQFLVDWFVKHPPSSGLRLCSYANCGRPETRRHEFRRCSACCTVNYCSRGCQALDWKLRHKYDCSRGAAAHWEDNEDDDEEDDENTGAL